jgi:hypothetical protein
MPGGEGMARYISRPSLGAAILCAVLHNGAVAQAPPLPPREEVPAVLTFLSPLLVPKVFQDCYLLKEYVRSGELRAARSAYGDLYAVDCVFDRAMRLSWNNKYEALLLCAFALMDHERFGVRLPVIGLVLWFPLTSEFPGEFSERLKSLPSHLYADTRDEEGGDRDKLQHFFGSAFLTALTESARSADRFGLFIEWGEALFVVGGVDDDRDVRANRQGQRFAQQLLVDPATRPSLFFAPEVTGKPGAPPGHMPVLPDSLQLQREAQ